MNNTVEYQKLYNQILEIRELNKKLNEKNEKLHTLLKSSIMIDDMTFKENEIVSLISDENKIIEEIDNIILPILKQKMM